MKHFLLNAVNITLSLGIAISFAVIVFLAVYYVAELVTP